MAFSSLFRKKSATTVIQQGGDGEDHGGMNKVLTVRDLTFFGIAAVIGGGTFSAIGNACYEGGPGVTLLYIICGIACGFTAMCYAEFASRVPVSGSAYTYAYVSFGELFAWIIGWALIMEYSIGNIYIAFSWSGYFTNLLESFHLHLPEWLTINYQSAQTQFAAGKEFLADYSKHVGNLGNISQNFRSWLKSDDVVRALSKGSQLKNLVAQQVGKNEGYQAVTKANAMGLPKLIFDMPAVVINILITFLVYRGTKESKNFSNAMVIIKLIIIVLVIVVGAFYIDIDNWDPFMPNGFGGVMAGVSAVFFAYIGFDAVSTLAEESKNPQRDLPRGMIYSLVICTVVYIILAFVITGMVKYDLLGVSDPLAEIFALKGVKWMLFIVSIAAVVAMTSVLLVFQMGQPRIWMTMSRDGLMPKRFASLHPKYKTPGFATIVTGLVVGIPIFFTDENFVLDFTSIGTLFAFVLVCGGVLTLSPHSDEEAAQTKGKFRIPYLNSKFIFPAILLAAAGLIMAFASGEAGDFIKNRRPTNPEALHEMIAGKPMEKEVNAFLLREKYITDATASEPALKLLEDIKAQDYREAVVKMPIDHSMRFEKGLPVFYSNIPMWIFLLLCLWMVVRCYTKNLSLIPVLGLVSCCYLLTGMAVSNWMWFGVWLVIGLVVYFCYGYRKSKLANPA